jgi:hypothetical protein
LLRDVRRLAGAILNRLREYEGLVAQAEIQADRPLAVLAIETVERSVLEALAQAPDPQLRQRAPLAESAAAHRRV